MIQISDKVKISNKSHPKYGILCFVTWISYSEGLMRLTPVKGDPLASIEVSLSEVESMK